MNIYLEWLVTILLWICYPIGIVVYYLAIVILTILKLLYRPLAFVLQPVVYFGRFVLACLAFPFMLLAKLEPLYNYLGVAALVGILGGLALAYTYKTLHGWLRLDAEPRRKPVRSRTAKQYRQDKAKQKAQLDQPLLSPGYFSLSDGLSSKGPRGRNRNLLATTIMEEADSDY